MLSQRTSRRRRWKSRPFRHPRPDHDGGYHLLFSHPRMVEDLLAGFIDEPWVAALDLDKLERVNAKLHGPSGLRIDGDMIWRVPLKAGGVAYIFIILEFQSTPDRWMAVRMAAAVILLYLHLIRETVRKKGRREPLLAEGKLPPVYPLVLFSGGDRWQAAQDLADLIAEVPGLGPWSWRPSIRYHVLAERTVPVDACPDPDNVAAVLFAIEQCRTIEAVQEQARRLGALLKGEENATLRRSFARWLTSVLAMARDWPLKATDAAAWQETEPMLRELAAQIIREREEAARMAAQQALALGRTEAKTETLIRLLERRFGPLPDERRDAIQEADLARIEAWFDHAIDAPNLDAVFAVKQ